jgi:ParB-like chromosome segregation protein Spo0J
MKSKIKLSDEIDHVDPHELKPNSLNEIIPEHSAAEYDQLKNDIRARGILTPLQAKRNGDLLAGMTRHRIALELDLPSVPVQWVESNFKHKHDEQTYIIKDNFLRRQLTTQQKIELYRIMYPQFDERVAEAKKVGKALMKGEKYEPKSEILSASKIASDTGQTRSAVMRQLQRQDKENLKQQKEFFGDGEATKVLTPGQLRKLKEDESFDKVHKYLTVMQKLTEIHTRKFKIKVADALRSVADTIENE